MMLHDKMIPGQFLLDIKKDHSFHPQSSANKLDFYNAYRSMQVHQMQHEAEVLDLSRRCDSFETRKTPSPYSSSFGTGSPSTNCSSPPNNTTTNAGLLYPNNTLLHNQMSSLYNMYYPKIKQENVSPPPAPVPAPAAQPQYQPVFPQNVLLQTLMQQNHEREERLSDVSGPHSPPAMPFHTQMTTTPTTTGEVKQTRPFKAFPRDPSVIAANFAAADSLLDSRVERYTEYRKRVLEQIRSSNGGQRTVTNPKMRRTNNRHNSDASVHDSDTQNNSNNNSESEDRMESSDNDSGVNTNGAPMDSSMTLNGVVMKDSAYFERRRKNNAAAKKSRDRRRIKEDEIAIRAAYLERQNIELLCQIDALKAQLAAVTKC